MNRIKRLFYLSLGFNVLMVVLFLYWLLLPNHNDIIPTNPIFTNNPTEDTFDFKKYLSQKDSDNIEVAFPYVDYLKIRNFVQIFHNLGSLLRWIWLGGFCSGGRCF